MLQAGAEEIIIGDRLISQKNRPFLIAEMSGNHNQSLERALRIVDAAAESGADALKIQTYTAETMTVESDSDQFYISEQSSLWKGKTLFQLYKEAYTPWEWHEPIFRRAREKGMIAFSSPFDETAVDFLLDLKVPCFKIASFENNHIPLLKKVAASGLPVIMSTGLATENDIAEAQRVLLDNGCSDHVLLKCTSNYPASVETINLRTIPDMRNRFGCQIGLSDHTLGIGVAVASVAFGATVIEKHFTLDRSEGGVDAAFSMEPHEFKMLSNELKNAFGALGEVSYSLTDKEKQNIRFKRSIYIVKDVKKGEALTKENTKVIRPSFGMHPRYYEEILGKHASSDLATGTPLSPDLVY